MTSEYKSESKSDSNFAPIKFTAMRGQGRFITIDRQKRMMISADIRRDMGLTDLMTPWIAVFYDKETRRIAIQKEELVKSAPVEAKTKVDRRGYFNARSILDAMAIDASRLPIRFIFDGDVSIKGERFLAFRMDE